MLIRLTRDVRGLGGPALPQGAVVEAEPARDGVMEVVGFGYLPLNPWEWEPVLSPAEVAALYVSEKVGKLEEAVERQAEALIRQELQIMEMEEGIAPRAIQEKERLEEAICALEGELATRFGAGEETVSIMEMIAALGDVANYATSGVASLWLSEAIQRMDAREEER